MSIERVRLTADPRFLYLLFSAVEVDPPLPNALPAFDGLIIPALRFIKGRTAADMVPILSRYTPSTETHNFELVAPPASQHLFETLFHDLSLSMPRGVEPLPWSKEQILTCALTLYCEAVTARSRLRLV